MPETEPHGLGSAHDGVPIDVDDSFESHARALTDGAADEGSARNWNELFRAVSARLRWVLGDRSARMQARVEECLFGLDQLHAAVTREIAKRHRLEQEVTALRTELARARDELAGTRAAVTHARRLATHDHLTSLPNRSLFLSRLDHALGLASPQRDCLAVLYLDLDDFKAVNDTHGHAVGDTLLKIVAERLAHAVRAEDIVSRLSGDEFACLLCGLSDRGHVARVADKLYQAVSHPLAIGTSEFSVRPSIGIAIYPRDGLDSEALLGNADAAMYRAKRRRCAYAFFDEGSTV